MEAIVTFMQSLGTRVTLMLVGRHGVASVLGVTFGLAIVGAVATAPRPTSAQTPQSTVVPSTAASPAQPADHCDGDW